MRLISLLQMISLRLVDFIEVKRQRKELDMDLLRKKADVFFKATGQYTDYHIQYRGMTMEDMELEKI